MGEFMDIGKEVVNKFMPYLDPATDDKGLPWTERGLVENAPPAAVKQYEAYCKMVKEME